MVDAAKNAGAHRIVVIAPYLGYMRQDKIHAPGEAHGASLIGKLLSAAGTDELIVCDPHVKDLQLLFNFPAKQVSSYPVFRKYVENLRLDDMCFVAPDTRALEAAKLYANYFRAKLVSCLKIRNAPNQVKAIKVVGNVENLHAILIDDIIDTGHTLVAAAEQLKKEGARSVRALCTHPVLSGSASERLMSSALEEIVVTNTIPLKQVSEKVKVLDVAPLILKAINE
jgi:ribose-phosphate pyrophosphokinase